MIESVKNARRPAETQKTVSLLTRRNFSKVTRHTVKTFSTGPKSFLALALKNLHKNNAELQDIFQKLDEMKKWPSAVAADSCAHLWHGFMLQPRHDHTFPSAVSFEEMKSLVEKFVELNAFGPFPYKTVIGKAPVEDAVGMLKVLEARALMEINPCNETAETVLLTFKRISREVVVFKKSPELLHALNQLSPWVREWGMRQQLSERVRTPKVKI